MYESHRDRDTDNVYVLRAGSFFTSGMMLAAMISMLVYYVCAPRTKSARKSVVSFPTPLMYNLPWMHAQRAEKQTPSLGRWVLLLCICLFIMIILRLLLLRFPWPYTSLYVCNTYVQTLGRVVSEDRSMRTSRTKKTTPSSRLCGIQYSLRFVILIR